MSQTEREILMRITHMDGEKKHAVLEYIRELNGHKRSKKKHRRSAMRQIRQALHAMD